VRQLIGANGHLRWAGVPVDPLGFGISWRPEIAHFIERRTDIGFIEVMAEDIDPLKPVSKPIVRLLERGLVVVPHGVSLSLGGAETVDPRRLARFARVADAVESPLVSEHIAYVRGNSAGDGQLRAVPRTREALRILIENVREVQAVLGVPLALENVATVGHQARMELDEASFIGELLERTDALLLLDIANLYASATNHRLDPQRYLDRVPLDRIAYVHVAGGFEHHGTYHDTHVHPIQKPVLELLTELCRRTSVPGVLWEHDECFGPDEAMAAEIARINHAVDQGAALRASRGLVRGERKAQEDPAGPTGQRATESR
jgi:uncharacterized protein